MNDNVQINYEQIVNGIRNQILSLQQEIIQQDLYAPVYDAKKSYLVGQLCLYESVLYRCITATSGTLANPETFDAEKWSEETNPDVTSRVNDFYAVISPLIGNLNFYVNLEQVFLKSTEKVDQNGVYVAVRFNRASVNFGSSICNVSLIIMGTANKVKPTQLFFSAFASKWTTRTIDGNVNTQQIWVTPAVQSNFNEFATDFRNLYEVSGTLIIGNKTVALTGGYITYHFVDGNNQAQTEVIPVMSFQDNFRNNLSPQPYGNTYGFSKSETNFSTYTFSFSTYLLDTQLAADCMHAKGFILPASQTGRTSSKEPNDDFVFTIHFTNGYTNNNSDISFFKTFKLVDCGQVHEFGEIPRFSASFTH